MTGPAPLVVDTSVAIKWYVPEPGAHRALELLSSDNHLIAPDLLVCEFGNVLWNKVRRGELTSTEATDIARALVTACPVTLRASLACSVAALDIALHLGRSVYDALYISLAVAEGGIYVTADERLVNALIASDLAPYVRSLGSERCR